MSSGKKDRRKAHNSRSGACEPSEDSSEDRNREGRKPKKRRRSDLDHDDNGDVQECDSSQNRGKKKKRRRRSGHHRSRDDNSEDRPSHQSSSWCMKRLNQLSEGSEYVMLPLQGRCCLLMKHPLELVLQGHATATILQGDIEVMGFDTRGWSERRLELSSASCCSFLTLRTVAGVAAAEVDADLCEMLKGKYTRGSLQQLVDSPVVLVVFEKTESPRLDFITSLPMYEDLFKVAKAVSGCNADLASCGMSVHTLSESPLPFLSLSRELKHILQDLQRACEDGNNPVILVCGGKNAGKSTLNRFILNNLLKRVSRVFYLECDLGQTEFTPPGCVSLQEVTTPLLGLPFTHQLKSKRLCYFGGVTPSDNPTAYIDCLKFVLAEYQATTSPGPLLVNTMGWNEGLGLNLLVDTVHLSQPDLVIQLQSGNRHRNFEAFSPQRVNQEPGWTVNSSMEQLQGSEVPASKVKEYKFCLVDSSSPTQDLSCFKLRPVDHRNLALLSHLCQDLPPRGTLTVLWPQTVAWRHLALHVCHHAVAPDQILYALNASLVALCCADLSTATKEAEHYPFTFQHLPVCECLGFGMVTGVDMESGLLYIVTPVKSDDLARVTLLMKGSVNLPDQLFLQQKQPNAPYVDVPVDTVGSSAIRVRDRMPRRPPPTPTS